MIKDFINKIKRMELPITAIFMAIMSLLVLFLLFRTNKINDAKDFDKYTKENHCYVFEYIQMQDGKIEKRWICNNEVGNDNGDN